MWIKIGNSGIQLRENEIDKIWTECEKRTGKGKRKWYIKTKEYLTGYEATILTFDDYTEASEALIKIVDALDERRARLEL